ncbi:MAG: anaerobic ribonucleoside-triphosphate reductase activating protein [Lachnospiraceae bacterium]
MRICGLTKTTLLDYPGKVACTVFIGGCNFRCPFCHNASLVTAPQLTPEITQEELFTFLHKRHHILQGICITGGEPTLYPQLPALLRRLHALPIAVKLDTNGTNPAMLAELLAEGVLSYVAMDIKSSPGRYPLVSGCASVDMEAISRSVSLLKHAGIAYEFRTTVVEELHSEADFVRIAKLLEGASACYLQPYRDSDEVLVSGFHTPAQQTLERYREILLRTVGHVEIRGI